MIRTIAASFLLLWAAAAAAAPKTLWDQSQTVATGGSPDMAADCAGGGSWHCANDVQFQDDVVIMRVTTYFAGGDGSAVRDAVQAWLWLVPKRGPVPGQDDDPAVDGTLVSVRVQTDGDRVAVRADGLSIALAPGQYWLALTPVVAAGPSPVARHLRAAASYGAPAFVRDSCRGDGWAPGAGGADTALLVEGQAPDVAPAELVDPFRAWRRFR